MSSLWDQLGLDPDDFSWRDLGTCSRIKIESPEDDLFFDRYENDTEMAKQVDQMCLHCPAMKQCFFAGSDGQQGVWGGVYWNGSGKPDKNKNAHKTEEDWEAIYRIVHE